jgi:hypothetical protein
MVFYASAHVFINRALLGGKIGGCNQRQAHMGSLMFLLVPSGPG